MKELNAELKILKLDLEDIITTSNNGLIDGGENGDFGDGEIVIPSSASLLD